MVCSRFVVCLSRYIRRTHGGNSTWFDEGSDSHQNWLSLRRDPHPRALVAFVKMIRKLVAKSHPANQCEVKATSICCLAGARRRIRKIA